MDAMPRIILIASFGATPKTVLAFCPPISTISRMTPSNLGVLSPPASLTLACIDFTLVHHSVGKMTSRTESEPAPVSRIAVTNMNDSSSAEIVVTTL